MCENYSSKIGCFHYCRISADKQCKTLQNISTGENLHLGFGVGSSEYLHDEYYGGMGQLDQCISGHFTGNCFELGKSFEESSAEKAMAIYLIGCEYKEAYSCIALGNRLMKGDRGFPKDEERGKGLLRRACDLGSAQGCYDLCAQYDRDACRKFEESQK